MALTYSYDVTTLVGQTRLHASDTSVAGNGETAIWSDQELGYFLTLVGNVPELAAARALRSAASDAAKMAVITKRGTRGNDETAIHAALLATAAELERLAAVAPAVESPDEVFSTRRRERRGSMTGW